MKFKSRGVLGAMCFVLAGCGVTSVVPETSVPSASSGHVSPPFQVLSKPAVKGILPPEAKEHASQLNADWWIWSNSIPFEDHPLTKQGNVDLSAYQPTTGNVWFLGGAFESGTFTRAGTVPTGTALFFPIINRSYAEDVRVATGELISPFPGDTISYPLTVETYRSLIPLFDAQGNPVVTNLTVTLDGETASQADLLAYYSESPIFEFDLESGTLFDVGCAVEDPVELIPGAGEVNNCWRADTSRVQAWGAGYFAYVKPLPPGEHTLRFTGTRGGFTLDVTYHLTVVPGS